MRKQYKTLKGATAVAIKAYIFVWIPELKWNITLERATSRITIINKKLGKPQVPFNESEPYSLLDARDWRKSPFTRTWGDNGIRQVDVARILKHV